MQDARREALAARLHRERVVLWNQDLDRVTSYLDSTTTQAALLLGFAFAAYSGAADGLKEELKAGDKRRAEKENWACAMFYVSGCITLGSFLYVVCMGQMTTILGPLLALKGPEGSMELALEKMKSERFLLFTFFSCGLVGFYFMLVACTWINEARLWIASTCTGLLSIFFFLVVYRAYIVYHSFSFKAPDFFRLVEASGSLRNDLHLGAEARKDINPTKPMDANEYLNQRKGISDLSQPLTVPVEEGRPASMRYGA